MAVAPPLRSKMAFTSSSRSPKRPAALFSAYAILPLLSTFPSLVVKRQ